MFNLSNLDNIGFAYTSSTKWLPESRWLHTTHSEPSVWCVSRIFSPQGNNIICLLQIDYGGLIRLRQHICPRLTRWFFTKSRSSSDGRCQQANPIIAKELTLSKSGRTHKTLHARNRCFNQSAVQGNSMQIYTEFGRVLNRIPQKWGRQLEHLQQLKMFTAYNEVHPKVIRNLAGTGTDDFGIQSVARSRPGCSLHQGASLWKDAPAGAAPGQNTLTWPCKPQHWTLFPSHIQQVHPTTAHTGKRRNSYHTQGIFQGKSSWLRDPT